MSCSDSMDCYLSDKIGMIERNFAVTAKYLTISGNYLNCAGARASAANVENICVRFFSPWSTAVL